MAGQGIGFHRPICPDGRRAQAAADAQPCPERSRPYVLAATILASALAMIDGTIVTIALPTMQADLAASFSRLQWVVNGYALLLGGLILIGGGAGDRFGRRLVFCIGTAVFALASLGCALAPSVETLIVARSVQGVGAALLVPQSLAIISAAFPKEIRGRAIGLWAGASAIATAMGPTLGGLMIDGLGWRSVFWINLPLAAGVLWLALWHVPESRDDSATGPLDWTGGALAIVGCGLLTVGLTGFAETGAGVIGPSVLVLAGIVTLGGFVRAESRAANPLMPLSLFTNRVFAGANATTVLLYGALSAVLFLLPFDLIARRGLSSTEAGLTMLPLGIVIGTLSRHAGAWADRVGPRPPLVLGSCLVALAAVLLALGPGDFWLGAFTPVVTISFGMALVVAPLTTAVMNAAPDAQSGAASGVNNAASRLAGLFAVAIVAALASLLFTASLRAGDVSIDGHRFGILPLPGDPLRGLVEGAFTHAYGTAMWVAAAWSSLAAWAAFRTLHEGAVDRLA